MIDTASRKNDALFQSIDLIERDSLIAEHMTSLRRQTLDRSDKEALAFFIENECMCYKPAEGKACN